MDQQEAPTALQQFLQAEGTLDALAGLYAIKATRHKRIPQLISFKYDQIHSPMNERLCQEARGCILDADQNWAYVARPWEKFWNYGEGLAAPIDWATARVQEKIDGSLCILYWYGNVWNVATSGTPDASGPTGPAGRETFAELFWATAQTQGLRPLLPAYTWLFELTAPQTRIVVQHPEPRLTLIGCRHTTTGVEMPLHSLDAAAVGVSVAREYPLTSMDDVLATFASLSPLHQEGYVIVSDRPAGQPVSWQLPRVKVKHPGYVALHHMRNRFTPRGLVEVVRLNETEEVLTAFPELHALRDLAGRYDILCAEITADWDRVQAAEWGSRRDFAAAALQTRCPAALFALRDKKAVDARAFLATMQPDRIVALLETEALLNMAAAE